jgi:hypothetical protein
MHQYESHGTQFEELTGVESSKGTAVRFCDLAKDQIVENVPDRVLSIAFNISISHCVDSDMVRAHHDVHSPNKEYKEPEVRSMLNEPKHYDDTSGEDETRSYEGGSYVYIRRQYIILRVRWRDIQPAGSCSLVVSIVNGDSTTESDSRRRMESLLSSNMILSTLAPVNVPTIA